MARAPRTKHAKPEAQEKPKAAAPRKGPSETPKPELRVVGGTGAPGSNSLLTDDEQRALFFHHRQKYEGALAAKKKADADFKNVCKLAKADDVDPDDIKSSLALGTPEGQATHQAKIEAGLRVARWMGMPVGSQSDLFAPDRRPATEKWEQIGFEAGAAGLDRKLPESLAASSPEGQAWFTGWHNGQDAIFNIQEKKGDPLLRPVAEAQPDEAKVDEVDQDEASSYGDQHEGSDDGIGDTEGNA